MNCREDPYDDPYYDPSDPGPINRPAAQPWRAGPDPDRGVTRYELLAAMREAGWPVTDAELGQPDRCHRCGDKATSCSAAGLHACDAHAPRRRNAPAS